MTDASNLLGDRLLLRRCSKALRQLGRHFSICLLLLLSSSAFSQTMYKCLVNGKIKYSGRSCERGEEIKRIAPNGGPTPEDRARAQMRVRAETQRFEDQDRAEQAERKQRALNKDETSTQRPSGSTDTSRVKSESEKVLVHGRDGWDRKPQAQIAAEEAARQDARARATRGEGPPAGDASPANGKSWENEKVLSHNKSGWDTKTRGQVVKDTAQGEYYREKARIESAKNPASNITSCDPGGCNDNFGHRYNGNGTTLIRNDGAVCNRTGATISCN